MLLDELFKKMQKINNNWGNTHKIGKQKLDPKEYNTAVKLGGFKDFEILNNDSGLWLYLENSN